MVDETTSTAAVELAGAAESGHRAVPAVSRAAAILRLLGKREDALGVNAIARELRLVPSTCLHILRVLVQEGLAVCEPATKRYRLGAGILAIARDFTRHSGFIEAAQPILDRLAERYAVTTVGVQVIGLDHMVVLAIAHTEAPWRLHVEVGSRFPALISASGRCLAAFGPYSWSELRQRFRTLRWHRAPSLETWRVEIERTRACGYSIDEGNYLQGLTILAVPVRDARGQMTHGLVAVGVSQQMEAARLTMMADEMRTLATGLEARLTTP